MNENLSKIAVAISLLNVARKLADDAVSEIGGATSPDVSTEAYRQLRSSVQVSNKELSDRVKDLKRIRDSIVSEEA